MVTDLPSIPSEELQEIAFYTDDGPVEFLWAEQLEAGTFRILTTLVGSPTSPTET